MICQNRFEGWDGLSLSVNAVRFTVFLTSLRSYGFELGESKTSVFFLDPASIGPAVVARTSKACCMSVNRISKFVSNCGKIIGSNPFNFGSITLKNSVVAQKRHQFQFSAHKREISA